MKPKKLTGLSLGPCVVCHKPGAIPCGKRECRAILCWDHVNECEICSRYFCDECFAGHKCPGEFGSPSLHNPGILVGLAVMFGPLAYFLLTKKGGQ